MLAKVHSSAVYSIDAYVLEIEVCVSRGTLPYTVLVGLPDQAVKESRDRVRAALINSGYRFPMDHITINLAPASRKKEGPAFELPIAIGLLAASRQIEVRKPEDYLIVGELALDGRVRAINGCLSMAMNAREEHYRGIVLPSANAQEAAVVEGLDVIPVTSLTDTVGFLSGQLEIKPVRLSLEEVFEKSASYDVDFADVKGQEHAKRALLVAAAGGHNVLMIGPPGGGKTMLAQRLPTILPKLLPQESLETTKVYSVSGLVNQGHSLIATRPFRTPHHTISEAGMVGGGTFPRPGELSLSNHGVLFLDELPEFDRNTLESLRQPLEAGQITISRAANTVTYPTNVMLVGAMNPCPCGYYGHTKKECHCTPHQIQKYVSKVSGPLLDRIDIHVEVPALEGKDLKTRQTGETSDTLRDKVRVARDIQHKRFNGAELTINAQMSNKLVKKHCVLDAEAETLLHQAMMELGLSARGYTKILKLARTIADLDSSDRIRTEHVSEAIQYRTLDRGLWR
ncbi:MAG: magnesium chelatase [Planctomycetes bacterium GWA2_50_13]|nr:MAG: magnesium chelatase [Planctomycetes bacterium GWA2_50_13]